jgi:hypothetical protein
MTHVEIAVTIEKNVWKRLGEMSLDQEVVERLRIFRDGFVIVAR